MEKTLRIEVTEAQKKPIKALRPHGGGGGIWLRPRGCGVNFKPSL